MRVILFIACLALGLNRSAAQYWRLAGNSDANSTSKLGTINTQNLKFITKNIERMRLDTTGRLGIGTLTPLASLDVSTTASQVARFNGPSTKMYISLYKNNVIKGYVGSYGGAASDVDFGTSSPNTTGAVHLTIKAVPQLTVTNTGNVGIGTTAPTTKLQVQGTGKFTDYSGYGVLGYGGNDDYDYGVYGNAKTGIYGYGQTYGVYGIGVLSYAGYFEGNVYTTGTYLPSARKLKQNITDLNSAMLLISRLQPREYEYRQDGNYKLMNLPAGKRYGFVAEELEEVLPSLVKETTFNPRMTQALDSAGKHQNTASGKIGFKAVNYTELIPVLIKAVQEQQQQIEDLKQMVIKLTQTVTGNSGNVAATLASLDQNTPNPFSNNTTIRYQVPQTAASAKVVITNSKGQIIKSISLTSKGSGQLNFNSAALAAGAYNYTLWVDGKQADTKRFIIAR